MDSNKYTPAYRESINISVESIALFNAGGLVNSATKSWFEQIYPGLSRVDKYLESIALFDTGGVINLLMYTGFSRIIYSTPHSSVILVSLKTRLVSLETRLVSRETRGGKFRVSGTVLTRRNPPDVFLTRKDGFKYSTVTPTSLGRRKTWQCSSSSNFSLTRPACRGSIGGHGPCIVGVVQDPCWR